MCDSHQLGNTEQNKNYTLKHVFNISRRCYALTLNHEVSDDSMEYAALISAEMSVKRGTLIRQLHKVFDSSWCHVSKESDLDSAHPISSNCDVKVDFMCHSLTLYQVLKKMAALL